MEESGAFGINKEKGPHTASLDSSFCWHKRIDSRAAAEINLISKNKEPNYKECTSILGIYIEHFIVALLNCLRKLAQ